MSGKLTVVLPTYSRNWAIARMGAATAGLWRPQCDELIVCEDGGMFWQDTANAATIYMLHENWGVAANMLWGWRFALERGADHVAMMDSDVTPVSGNLRDLCLDHKIGVPAIAEHPDSTWIAPMLCVPRTVSDERGFYSDRWRNDTFDTEYGQRTSDLIEKVKSVIVTHIGSGTRGENVPIPFPNVP